ncbi:MAG TPA: hypothetical protein VFV67_21705 [Actinophytocola sp.]|uniref:hypothetical protein n=1 Tax=Actinophytocola sp. TaxID=1872138 RepID=UPI002DBA0729|nr:hypothetical protein [Actinophytocola sp.]HEU5473269.1 hypothetical protein [Actinophytocola sp.]
MSELASEPMSQGEPGQGAVPGSGALTERERALTARVHTVVTVEPDTVLVKPLRPGSLERYLHAEVSAGRWGERPPFDYRVAGGTVARLQDLAGLRTPADLLRAFRLDYPGSPFRPDLPELHLLAFAATQPAQLVIPLGAPALPYPRTGYPPNMTEVRVAALRMIEAAEAAGVDPNAYRMELNPWPYTGTGITADPETGVPVRWRRYAPLPAGAVIMVYRLDGSTSQVASYRGAGFGWRAER